MLLLAGGLLATIPADAATVTQWPAWERFKTLYISADGRVIDDSVPQKITTSEGQSYALFFALIANDRETFTKVLRWTQDNLAQGDLAKALPAWQWGRAEDGSWRVLDPNAASDADLWIAYALHEGGRLWCDNTLASLGRALTARILREEVTFVPGLGPTLLPGPRGFVEQNTWRLNASYVPLQLIRALARHSQDKLWRGVLQSSEQLIAASAPRGFAADWTQFRTGEGFIVDRETQGIGSYNAIRVYLWAGTLPPSDPLYNKFARLFEPMLASTAQRSAPVEIIDTQTLKMSGDGSPGFSAALLPLLAKTRRTQALAAHRSRVETQALQHGGAYYSDVLSLFGLGFIEGRYRFDTSGQVELTWKPACRGGR